MNNYPMTVDLEDMAVKEQTCLSKNLSISLDDITDGWWRWTIGLDQLYLSPKFKALFGYKDSELDNTMEAWKTIIYPEDYARAITALDAHIEYGENYCFPARYYHKNGATIWVICRGHTEQTLDGKKTHVIGTHTDITPMKDSEYRLNMTANYDSLTQLPNRHSFLSILYKSVYKAETSGTFMAVLFLDLDDFKIINDSFGHKVGDEILKQSAKKMVLVTRKCDFIARLSGDEFGIIVENVSDIDEIKAICQRYVDVFHDPLQIEQIEVGVSVSIGAAAFPDAGTSSEKLIQHADMAMYNAKHLGKGTYTYFTKALGCQMLRKNSIRNALQKAASLNELYVEYQPVVDIQQNTIIGVEALLRWRNEKLGEVAPHEFISIAEESDLIVDIGQWCLEKACHDFATITKQEPWSHLTLSLNVSMRQLSQVGFVEMLTKTCQQCGLKLCQFIIELTESAIMRHPRQTAAVLRELSRYGVKFALDDFGMEYSVLKYLKHLPIHIIKIDQEFMRNIKADVYNLAIVNAVISLANSLRLDIIAEGVTDLDTVRFLKEHNCWMAQGYYYSKPLDQAHLLQFLKHNLHPVVLTN